jgi:hypothetical protein
MERERHRLHVEHLVGVLGRFATLAPMAPPVSESG